MPHVPRIQRKDFASDLDEIAREGSARPRGQAIREFQEELGITVS